VVMDLVLAVTWVLKYLASRYFGIPDRFVF